MDSLPSIHRNGQRRHPPIRRRRASLVARNGTKVATLSHCSRSDAPERYWSEQMDARISTLRILPSPRNSRAKPQLLVVAGRGEIRSRNERSQESGGISGDGRNGTRGMDEEEKHNLCNKWPERETEGICGEAFGGDRPSETKGGGAGGLGGSRRDLLGGGWEGRRSDREWRCGNGALKP